MIQSDCGNCTETLLDMLCYEAFRERLSPEMEALLADHLAECEQCRSKALSLRQLLESRPGSCDNLAFLVNPHCLKVF
jgi:hypothetical protein